MNMNKTSCYEIVWIRFLITTFIVSIATTGTAFAQSKGADGCINGVGSGCAQLYGGSPKSGNVRSGTSQTGNNAAAAQVLIQGALQAFTQMAEDSDRRSEELQREQERIQRDKAIQQQRIAQQQEQLQERTRQIEANNRAPDGSSKDNPWGSGGGSSAEGDTPGAGGAQSGPLDPSADYTGQSCSYFTCNAVKADGAGTNFHQNGAFIIYGKVAYQCDAGHWTKKGPAAAWLPEAERRKAEIVERGCSN